MDKLLGWHFASTNETLRYGDGRKIIVGETHEVEPPIMLCKHGLHASVRVIDALGYAPGPILYRVELSGEIITSDDKAVATHRKYLARIDATKTLDQFTRACALSVAYLWEPPDVVMQFLLGDESAKAAAWDAAKDAAKAAVRDAARDAAWAAAKAAAKDAVWAAAKAAAINAAWAAAWAAAWDATRNAAWAAARAEQNDVLTEYVLDAMGLDNE